VLIREGEKNGPRNNSLVPDKKNRLQGRAPEKEEKDYSVEKKKNVKNGTKVLDGTPKTLCTNKKERDERPS